ncbi:importin-5, partial [Tanacetum coccineum]
MFKFQALSRLNDVIRHPNALHPDNMMAYDNVVSALGKLYHFHRDCIHSAQADFDVCDVKVWELL